MAEDVAQVLTSLTQAASQAQGASPQQKAGPAQPLVLKESVFLTADKATNSLIIRAEPQDYEVLKGIIAKLDIQRAQVLVEAVIMEISAQKARALGAEWRLSINLRRVAGWQAFGGTNLPAGGDSGLINQVATQLLGGPSGLVLGAAKGTSISAV